MEVNIIKIVIVSADNPFVKVKVGGKHIHILNFYDAIRLKGLNVEVISFEKNINKKNLWAIFSYVKFKLFGNKIAFNQTPNLRFNFLIKTVEDDLARKIKKILNEDKSEDIFFIAEDVIAINAINLAKVDPSHTFAVLHGYFTYEAIDLGSIIEDEKDLSYFYDLERKAYACCSKIVTVDSAIKNYLVEKMGVSSEKIKVIYNAIDIDEFKVDLKKKQDYKLTFFKERNLKEVKNLILIARRLVNKNGVFYGVKSMSILKEISKDVYDDTLMVICGDGPEKQIITQLIEKENLSNNVLLLGQVDHNEIKNIYRAADVVIVPSIYTETKFAEATSLAALEAMASYSTVIVTNVGGLKEIVQNERTGFIVKDKSSSEIANVLLSIFKSHEKEKIEEILNNAFRYVIREHDFLKHSEKILSFFSIKVESD